MIDSRIMMGRYALITGGSRGIGKAIAETLARAGCSVAVTSRNEDDARKVAGEIGRKYEVTSLGAACDVSDLAAVGKLFQRVREWSGGHLDALVCNAGYPFVRQIWDTPLHSLAPEQIEAWYVSLFRTDTLGSVFCTAEALRLMVPQKTGSVIYISSTPALEGFQGTPYTVAKAGILGLMKDVAREYGPFNIRANALALGNIRTPATFENLAPEERQAMAREAPLQRWGEPEEVGRAALFLASDLSSFVTGQTVVVDGGHLRR